jgi:hypothetical protein
MVHRLNTDLQATAVLVAALHMSAFGTKRTSVKRHLFVRLRRKSRHQRPPIEIYPPSDVASIARRLDAAAAAILA